MAQATASKKINFQDIVKLELLSDDEEIVLISLKSRTVRLVVSDSVGFLSAIQRNMKVCRGPVYPFISSCVCTFIKMVFFSEQTSREWASYHATELCI